MTYPDFRVTYDGDSEMTPFFNKVESLGISCELGLVQRHCNSDRMGLFRFGYTPLDGLIAALESEFHGIEDVSQITAAVGHDREWMTTHNIYGFEFHTHHRTDTDTEIEIRNKMSTHFLFLANKMKEDLRDGEKIFVYRPREPGPADEKTLQLLSAIRKYGKSILLWIDVSANSEKAGTAEWNIPGQLMTGYIEWFSQLNWAAGASYPAWLKVIRSAVELKCRGE